MLSKLGSKNEPGKRDRRELQAEDTVCGRGSEHGSAWLRKLQHTTSFVGTPIYFVKLREQSLPHRVKPVTFSESKNVLGSYEATHCAGSRDIQKSKANSCPQGTQGSHATEWA